MIRLTDILTEARSPKPEWQYQLRDIGGPVFYRRQGDDDAWQFTDAEKGWVGFGSIRLMEDNKQLGTLGFNPDEDRDKTNFWGSEIKTNSSFKIRFLSLVDRNLFK